MNRHPAAVRLLYYSAVILLVFAVSLHRPVATDLIQNLATVTVPSSTISAGGDGGVASNGYLQYF